MQKPLKIFFGHSIFLHLSIIGLCIGITKMMNISFERRVKANMVLVESSVRIDMVAMPKLTVKELRNVKPMDLGGDKSSAVNEPAKKIESQNDSKIEFEKKGDKKLSFMERMKLLAKQKAKVEKSKTKSKSSSRTKKINSQSNKELQDLVLAGNKLSKGSSIIGSGAGSTTAFQGYVSEVTGHVKMNWKLPSYLLNKDLKCRIKVFLSANGKVLRTEVYESSGNEEYDRRAIDTIMKSSPFPSLSKDIRARGNRGDLVLGFPL